MFAFRAFIEPIALGKTVIEGKQVAINIEFARQVLFLSQQLECSERYTATLLDEVMKENPNIDAIISLELTVELFHLRRRHLVDSLRYLVDATEAADSIKDNKTYARLARYFITELIPASSSQGGSFTLVTRIWKQIEHLDALISRADNARRGAASNTVAPTGPGAYSYNLLNSHYMMG
jgi:nuclear pore complex protein Nup205